MLGGQPRTNQQQDQQGQADQQIPANEVADPAHTLMATTQFPQKVLVQCPVGHGKQTALQLRSAAMFDLTG